MSTAIVPEQKSAIVIIEDTITSALPKLRQLMPSQLLDKPDIFLRSVMMAMRQTPELVQCTPQSIIISVAQACALGLPPNTPLGLSYLVPFKDQCQLIPGYKGLIRLAIQSGEVTDVQPRVVYDGQPFKIKYGLVEDIDHEPTLVDFSDEKLVGAYAVAVLPNSTRPKFDFMYKQEIDRIRAKSQAAKSQKSPWHTDYAEMAKKTVIKRLCKTLPLSEEKDSHRRLGKAIQLQERDEMGLDPLSADIVEVFGEPTDSKKEPRSLAEKAGAN
jgi:recombination protein RecT